MRQIQNIIEDRFNKIQELDKEDQDLQFAVKTVIDALDCGSIRVAEQLGNNKWVTNDWIKKAILISFRLYNNQLSDGQYTKFYDKLELKFANYNASRFQQEQIRVVPSAIVRRGAFIGRNTVLMPSYINIGASVGTNCMIDTWATIGSCAQIGNNVHISGGVGIGGVLEPLQANPTIIEDNCFIGARSEVVEGVIIGTGSVLGMGVFIGKSTKIYNRNTKNISYGYIPPYSVVVAGSIPSADNTHSTYAAIIVKQVDEQTRSKVSINELLRD